MQTIADLVLTLSGIVVLGAFTWATRKHFVTAKAPVEFKVISLVSITAFAAFLHQLWTLEQGVAAHALGLSLFAVALVLFAAAIRASRKDRLTFVFEKDEPRFLLRHGPYRVIRHPFYTSYTLFWIGCAVAAASPVSALFAAILFAIYVVAARTEEGKFQQSPLAAEYAAYRRETGFFWPRLRA
ncbi:MAG TPA: methyltransferase [Azospirillaceae bacterium]|nr:methyltransferase [Azospirillaceae bacterium]